MGEESEPIACAEPEAADTVRIHLMGKEYRVPKGLTIMSAIEYAGYRFLRGAGCRAGFCGACGTVYRLGEDYKLRFSLACQTSIEDDMYLVQLPFVPATRHDYDLDKVGSGPNAILVLYPEIARCVTCNTCTKACPQEVETMNAVQAALRGDYEKCAHLTFDCIQCGLCSMRCPADIKHMHVFQLARRIYSKFLDQRSSELETRIGEVESGKFVKEIDDMIGMDLEKVRDLYKAREKEK